MKPGPYDPFPYSPIIRRPPLEWPGDARVALWNCSQYRVFLSETRPGGLGPGKIPDIPIWAMRDYGNRSWVHAGSHITPRDTISRGEAGAVGGAKCGPCHRRHDDRVRGPTYRFEGKRAIWPYCFCHDDTS